MLIFKKINIIAIPFYIKNFYILYPSYYNSINLSTFFYILSIFVFIYRFIINNTSLLIKKIITYFFLDKKLFYVNNNKNRQILSNLIY